MVAVSSITPGPVGVNVATFAGFATSGVLGSLIATTAVVLPSYVLVIIVSKLLEKFKRKSRCASGYLWIKTRRLRTFSCSRVRMFAESFSILGAVLFCVLLYISFKKKKKDPLFYLGFSAAAGLIAGFLHLT